MEATYFDIDIKEELERYKKHYNVNNLFEEVINNKDSYLNEYISTVEGLIEQMEPEIYGGEELVEPLLRTKGILGKLKTLKQLLREYVINYNCVDII